MPQVVLAYKQVAVMVVTKLKVGPKEYCLFFFVTVFIYMIFFSAFPTYIVIKSFKK